MALLIYLFRAIITQSYQTAVMVTYYIRALEHNHLTNDKRVRLYKRGWIFAMISLGLFVCYICLNQ